jgi:hypothetical protein
MYNYLFVSSGGERITTKFTKATKKVNKAYDVPRSEDLGRSFVLPVVFVVFVVDSSDLRPPTTFLPL